MRRLQAHFVNLAVNVDVLQSQAGGVGDYFRRVVLQRNGMNLERSTTLRK